MISRLMEHEEATIENAVGSSLDLSLRNWDFSLRCSMPSLPTAKGRAADNGYTDGWSMDAAAALKEKVNR
jgi:hypothetical protein